MNFLKKHIHHPLFKHKTSLAIIGPTAIGKSKLACEIAENQALPHLNEIISADAYQVYCGFDIGTGKLSAEHLKHIPHHFINHLQATERYSVAQFCKATNSLLTNQKQYIIAGGTAFYVYALLHQYPFEEESRDPKQEASLLKRFEEKGGQHLLEELKDKDPESAMRIPATHKHALVRALLLAEQAQKASQRRQKTEVPRSDIAILGLQAPRELLYQAINKRVETLITAGWIEEVRELIKTIPTSAPAFKAIGYKDVLDYIHGKVSKEEMINRIQQKTRHFAKRQLTWYRKFKDVYWINSPYI